MKILLDTHVIIWALTDDSRLNYAARDLLSAPENLVFYSVASLWEIAIKNQKAPDKCPYHEKETMEFCSQAGYLPLDIQAAHVFGVRNLKIRKDRIPSNYDPFDRILLSQAKTEASTFLSHDTVFENYDESCIFMI